MMDTTGLLGQRSVVLTTDCGADMDDQWALAHLALTPGLRLDGIVTTHAPNLAPPAARTAVRHVNDVLDLLPLPARLPVTEGAGEPLADRHPRPGPGSDFILDRARSHSAADRLVVLVIGAATDVATALLVDPSLGERIEVVAMAFDGLPNGEDQFNVRNDPIAWRILLESTAPVTVGDADVTLRDLTVSRRQAEELFGDEGPAGESLVRLLAGWLDAHPGLVRRVTGDPEAWPVWDQVVVAHLLGLTTTRTHPRPRLRDDLGFDHTDATGQSIAWITSVDAPALWLDLRRRLRSARPD